MKFRRARVDCIHGNPSEYPATRNYRITMHVYVRCVVGQSALVIGTKKNRSGRRRQRRPAGEVAKEFEVRELRQGCQVLWAKISQTHVQNKPKKAKLEN